MIKASLQQLAEQIRVYCDTDGEATVISAQDSAKAQLLWLDFLQDSQLTGSADSLLEGARSAIRECAVCAAIGLARPAILAMRLQIDLALGWLYFKDHPREWERVHRTGDGFKLKADTLKYLGDHFESFPHRFGILKAIRTRPIEDPYRLLSAHVHGQSESTLPVVDTPLSVLCSAQVRAESLKILAATSEYISDIYWSVFADDKYAVPGDLKNELHQRFMSQLQRASFYAGRNIEAE
ncbi:hypothetical protein [Achromobacter insolitus]|uniref:hypothetical protein n=1 Tax=Achromobacter insolitus TaxID=217204 RepID=UPI0036705973